MTPLAMVTRRARARRGVASFWVLALGGIATAIVAASAASVAPFAVEARRRDDALQASAAAEAGVLAARAHLARTPAALPALEEVPFGRARVTVRLLETPGEPPLLVATAEVTAAALPGARLTRELHVRLGPPGADGLPQVLSWEERR